MDSATRERLQAQAERELFFLAACGAAGRRWLAQLQGDACMRVRVDLADAMHRLRTYDLAGGERMLAAIHRRLLRQDGLAAVAPYLWRWHFSTRAYLHYLRDDLAAGDADLTRAEEQVLALVGGRQFLLPLAYHCTDFVIQRARMARRRCRWQETRAQLLLLRGILSGERPYCVLPAGRAVSLADLRAFFAALALDDDGRRRAATFLGDDGDVEARVAQLAAQIYALPDQVIPFG